MDNACSPMGLLVVCWLLVQLWIVCFYVVVYLRKSTSGAACASKDRRVSLGRRELAARFRTVKNW